MVGASGGTALGRDPKEIEVTGRSRTVGAVPLGEHTDPNHASEQRLP